MDPQLQEALVRLVAYLVVAPVHGFALAFAAGRLGDAGPAHAGRRTLNPLRHVDIVGGLGFVLFGFGWIRPMRLDRKALRFGRLGLVLVVLVGLAATLLSAGLAELIRRPLIVSASAGPWIYAVVFLQTLATLSIAFVLINLIPLPPLTGAHLLAAVLPVSEAALARYRVQAVVLVAAFVASGLAAWIFQPVYRPAARFLLGA